MWEGLEHSLYQTRDIFSSQCIVCKGAGVESRKWPFAVALAGVGWSEVFSIGDTSQDRMTTVYIITGFLSLVNGVSWLSLALLLLQ